MRILLVILCAAALGLASCITIGTPAPVNLTPAFVTATLRPTKTPYASPSSISTASTAATLAATAAPNCKDAAVLLQDVTIADGTNVAYGAKFTKTWQFSNSGACPWRGYTISFVSGDRMGAPDSALVADTAPKSTVNVSVDLIAPTTDGIYKGIFELRNANGQALAIGIEKSFWVEIAVGNASVATLPPASSPVATITGTLTTPKAPGSCKYVLSPSYPSEIIGLINKARTDVGLSELTVNAQLKAAAQGHSVDMACFGFYGHTGSNGSTVEQRIRAAGYPGGHLEEMVYASGYPQDAFNWWMGDPIHHDVIFDTQITNIGVGYAYILGDRGYYTVDVGN
jgi:uncharacterized protein YkwD